MAQTLADRFRRWFEYEKDSHAKVLASLQSVPVEQHGSPAFRKALTLMGHIVAARRIWLFRLGVSGESAEAFFREDVTLAELAPSVASMQTAWSAYLDRLQDADLARVFEYQSWEGDWYRNSVEEILTQLFGHSWYHRGQIASLVRSAGGEPAATDFVFWTRKPISPPQGTPAA
jgi:uncharacterized damage-inducible protein DinB